MIRGDWEQIKVQVMEITLRLKLICNWVKLGNLLLETGDKAVVELSKKDPFWGMMPIKGREKELEGENQLGRLIWSLRDELRDGSEDGRRRALSMWMGDDGLNLRLFGETLPQMTVAEAVYQLGEKSFSWMIRKHPPTNPPVHLPPIEAA